MFIHFNSIHMTPFRTKRTSIFLSLTLLIIWSFRTEAQQFPVTISISVLPPYTSKIDDYIYQPHKVMATLLNIGTHSVSVYLQGTIGGDNGVRVYTDPDYKPSQPILLQPGIPFMINQNNLGQIFNADHLIYIGVTKKELIYGNGIPEGDYTI